MENDIKRALRRTTRDRTVGEKPKGTERTREGNRKGQMNRHRKRERELEKEKNKSLRDISKKMFKKWKIRVLDRRQRQRNRDSQKVEICGSKEKRREEKRRGIGRVG